MKRIITGEEVETRIANATTNLDVDSLVDMHNMVSCGAIKYIDSDKFELTEDDES